MDNTLFEIDKSNIGAYPGIVIINREDLEKLKSSKRKATIHMVGLLVIAKDVSPDLAKETIDRVKVCGIIKASPEVKQVLKLYCR